MYNDKKKIKIIYGVECELIIKNGIKHWWPIRKKERIILYGR